MTYDTVKLSRPADKVPIEQPLAIEDTGVLNDELTIEIAPDRPCGTIRVRLAYAEVSTRISADNPWAD
jgi:hypothetical protein